MRNYCNRIMLPLAPFKQCQLLDVVQNPVWQYMYLTSHERQRCIKCSKKLNVMLAKAQLPFGEYLDDIIVLCTGLPNIYSNLRERQQQMVFIELFYNFFLYIFYSYNQRSNNFITFPELYLKQKKILISLTPDFPYSLEPAILVLFRCRKHFQLQFQSLYHRLLISRYC